MTDHHAWVERAAHRLPRTTRGVVLAAALTFGTAGGLVGTVIVSFWVGTELLGPSGATPGAVGIAAAVAGGAGLAAAVTGGPLWWLVVERPGAVSLLRGALVGAVVGILAHPLMWAFAGVAISAAVLVVEGPSALAGVDGDAVIDAVGMFVVFTTLGLLFTGIVTVAAAAGTGVALARVRECAEKLERSRRRHV